MSELQSTPVSKMGPEEIRARDLDEAIAKARAQGHDELWHLAAREHDILFRCPTEQQFQRATGKIAEDKKKAPETLKELALAVVVHPDAATFRAICAKRPGLAAKVGSDAIAIASEEDAEFARKV